jgi:hypothetical protein
MSEQASLSNPWWLEEYQSVRSRSLRYRCSQLKKRSTTQRNTPNPLPGSVCRRATAGSIERSRNSARCGSLSYARSAYNFSGRCFGRPPLPATGSMASTTSSSSLTSGTLAAVTSAASGIPWASTTAWCLLPLRPRSVGFGPVSSPPPRARVNELVLVQREQEGCLREVSDGSWTATLSDYVVAVAGWPSRMA